MTAQYTSVLDDATRTIGAMLWQLYKHQDFSDPIGQNVRAVLNIAPDALMTEAQVDAAKRYGESIARPPVAPTAAAVVDERLARAERALIRSGFTYLEGAAEWKPPRGKAPRFIEVPAPVELQAAIAERDESDAVLHKLAQILAETAVALKGPEGVRRRHGYADLPELVAALKAERDALAARVAPAVQGEAGKATPIYQINSAGNVWIDCTQDMYESREGAQRRIVYAAPAYPVHPDDAAVDRFAARMKKKMAESRAKGRSGWETCTPTYLSRLLREHVEKGDPVDVANFCMMLSADGSGIDRADPGHEQSTFQEDVEPWMMECFGSMIAGDREERNHRFLEESLELVQSCGCTASEAHQLVDYVFGRPVGETAQETGGVMVTLAALCLANRLDMHDAGETELARIWTKVEQIRAKQAAKPKHSPLPAAPADPVQQARADQREDRLYRNGFLAGWNAGLANDTKRLAQAQRRAGNLSDYLPAATFNADGAADEGDTQP